MIFSLVIFSFFSLLLFLLLYFYFKRYNFLIDPVNEQDHKIQINEKIPLIGGFYLFFSISVSSFFLTSIFNYYFLTVIFFFLILGYFSDTKLNFKPKYRFYIQFLLSLIFVLVNDLKIISSGLYFLDKYLIVNFFNFFFTTICLLIILNGFNFCDGVNCNVPGYFLILTINILLFFEYQTITFIILLIPLIIIYFFNLFNKIFLGDNGVYILALIYGFLIINLINNNLDFVTPILAINLLWYPAFENLFTIIRRSTVNENIEQADRNHLHNLIFNFLLLKFKKRVKLSNSLTGIIINLYNFLSIYISMNYVNDKQVLLLIVITNIIIYVTSYLYFYKNINKI